MGNIGSAGSDTDEVPAKGVPPTQSNLQPPGPSRLSREELERLRSEMGMDCEKYYNFGVCGETGTGKSTLINAVCDLKESDSKAAPVGHYGSKTKIIKSYRPAKYPNTVVWDIPGTNSIEFPLDTYFPAQKLAAFDLLIIVTDKERFTETCYNLATRAEIAKVPVVFVRTKADMAVDEARKRIERDGSNAESGSGEVQPSKEAFEEEVRDQCHDTIRLDMAKVGLAGNMLCILSSFGFDEKRKDRYPAFDKKPFLDLIRALAMARRPQLSK